MTCDPRYSSTVRILRISLAVGFVATALILVTGCGAGGKDPHDDGGAPSVPEDTPDRPADASVSQPSGGEREFSDRDLIVDSGDVKRSGGGDASGRIAAPKLVGIVPVVQPYPDKSLKRRWSVKKYTDDSIKNHGKYEEFYPDGTKFCEGEYVDGDREGEWRFSHPNGKIAKIGKYSESKPVGKWTIYRDDGTIKVQENYVDGEKDGLWVYNGDDGKTVLAQEEYRQNAKHGTWITWYKPAKKEPGAKLQQAVVIHYRNGLLHGERVRWHKNGQKAIIESYKDGQPHGTFMQWDQRGTPLGEYEFENGRRKMRSDGSSAGHEADSGTG